MENCSETCFKDPIFPWLMNTFSRFFCITVAQEKWESTQFHGSLKALKAIPVQYMKNGNEIIQFQTEVFDILFKFLYSHTRLRNMWTMYQKLFFFKRHFSATFTEWITNTHRKQFAAKKFAAAGENICSDTYTIWECDEGDEDQASHRGFKTVWNQNVVFLNMSRSLPSSSSSS